MSVEKLGAFLRDVSNWTWEEFCRAENDNKYTSNEAIIFALIRVCANQKLSAIQIVLNRLDGKLKTPIRVEYPKIYYQYPNAKQVENPTVQLDDGATAIVIPIGKPKPVKEVEIVPPVEPPKPDERDLATMSLRETLTEMADYPRELPEAIMQLAVQTEEWLRDANSIPDEIPKVKSVVAAALLTLAQTRNLNAITEVFDQIDGKLVETIHLIGEDIYINVYSAIAPAGATRNEEGILQLEATEVQRMWKAKLGGGV